VKTQSSILIKRVLLICFVVFFFTMIYLGTTGRVQGRLGTFRKEAKIQIETELQEVCSVLVRTSVARCSAVTWQGKHRWFGRVLLEASSSRPSAGEFAKIISQLGWVAVGASAGVAEYRRENMELTFYAVDNLVQEFAVTANR
jgi:hypothetical protein